MTDEQAAIIKKIEETTELMQTLRTVRTLSLRRTDEIPAVVINSITVSGVRRTNTGRCETRLVQVSAYSVGRTAARQLGGLLQAYLDGWVDQTQNIMGVLYRRSELLEDPEKTAAGETVFHSMNEFEVEVFEEATNGTV